MQSSLDINALSLVVGGLLYYRGLIVEAKLFLEGLSEVGYLRGAIFSSL